MGQLRIAVVPGSFVTQRATPLPPDELKPFELHAVIHPAPTEAIELTGTLRVTDFRTPK